MADKPSHVVVGVTHSQVEAIVTASAAFAERFEAELVCAYVDASRYQIQFASDGSVFSLPLDPDLDDNEQQAFDEELQSRIETTLAGRNVTWSTQALAGGPAQELSALAERLDAAMIIVGTREPGFVSSLREFVTGSVAVQLSHRQHRPVVVVPLNPVVPSDSPWQP